MARNPPKTPEPTEPERLSVPEIAEALKLTPEQLAVLDDIASGRTVNGRTPGAREIMAALSLKASMSVAKPRERQEHEDRTVIVVSPFCERCAAAK